MLFMSDLDFFAAYVYLNNWTWNESEKITIKTTKVKTKMKYKTTKSRHEFKRTCIKRTINVFML